MNRKHSPQMSMVEQIERELVQCKKEYSELTQSSQIPEAIDSSIKLSQANLICPYMPLILKKLITLFSTGTRTLEEFKGQLFSVLTSTPSLAMENHEHLNTLLGQLTDELLLRSADALNSARLPLPYAQAITSHYIQLRGLRARVREDMASFVDLYNRTNSIRQVSTRQSDYMRFFEDYNAISSESDLNHTEATRFVLTEAGASVMRRMLIMGTHLLQLALLWEKADHPKQA